jgi:hypothetical protein
VIQWHDDHREKRPQAAAAFEAPQHLRIAFDEMEPDFPGEVLRLGAAQAMTAAHQGRHIVNDGKTGEKE